MEPTSSQEAPCRGRLQVGGSALALAGLIGLLDYWTGYEWGFSIFYLIPVLLATRLAGQGVGLFVSVASAGTWMLADSLGRPGYGHPLVPYWNGAVRLGFFVILALILARLQAAMERERARARLDGLTGLANSASFLEAVEGELQRSRRYGHTFTLVYIDCDNFKAVNDNHGHPTGDRLLRLVGHTLRAESRSTDIVARLGGDEFACLYPETGAQEAATATEKVRQALLARMRDHGWPVTFSFGVVTDRAASGNASGLVKVADDAMYAAKKAGKDRIHSIMS